jgi:hypothetical protein
MLRIGRPTYSYNQVPIMAKQCRGKQSGRHHKGEMVIWVLAPLMNGMGYLVPIHAAAE